MRSAERAVAGPVPPASPQNVASAASEVVLDDAERAARIDAIYRLHGLHPQQAVPILQRLVFTEKDGEVVEEALAVMRVIGGEDATRAVTTDIGDPDVERREGAIEALGRVGPAAVHLLGQAVFAEPDPGLRLLAVEQLSDIDTPAARSMLVQASGDEDPTVSQTARDVLDLWQEDFGDPASAADEWLSVFHTDGAPALTALVSDLSSQNDMTDRITAMHRIHELDEEQAIGMFSNLLRWDTDPAVRTEAFFALETYSDEAADHAVAIALGDDSPELRHEALLAMWATGDSDRYLVAAQLLQSDPDLALRREVVQLLAQDPDPRARLFLELLLSPSER